MADERFDALRFAENLRDELYRRYQLCDALVTPDTILLAVTNAVDSAINQTMKREEDSQHE